MIRCSGCVFAILFQFALPAVALSAAADDAFPGREVFQDVPIVTLEKLGQTQEEVQIVDVRTPYEYDTIHVQGAVNVPISSPDFAKRVRALRGDGSKSMVFYCNGHTCYKSYKATRTAQLFGEKDVYAFDGGIFDWARAYPDRTVLLGKSPIDPSRLISKKEHQTRLISPEKFGRYVGSDKYRVIDVRSLLQRSAVGLFPLVERWASLGDTQKLGALISQAQRDGKTLLIYDKVGKQIRWLEYRLRAMQVKDYYFMKGGSTAYYEYLGVPVLRFPSDVAGKGS